LHAAAGGRTAAGVRADRTRRAHRADTAGNLVYRYTARNFNPVVATAGRVTVAEVDEVVEEGEIHPDHVVTPSIYVQRVVRTSSRVKHIEQRTTRQRTETSA
ncbi:CoA-transferase, partial [Streptomyces sp. NPDC002172]